jgi:hypothetical protein
LGLGVTCGEGQRFVTHAPGLTHVRSDVPDPAQLYPQQRIVRLDAHRPLDGRGGEAEVTSGHLLVRLSHERC